MFPAVSQSAGSSLKNKRHKGKDIEEKQWVNEKYTSKQSTELINLSRYFAYFFSKKNAKENITSKIKKSQFYMKKKEEYERNFQQN